MENKGKLILTETSHRCKNMIFFSIDVYLIVQNEYFKYHDKYCSVKMMLINRMCSFLNWEQ